MRKIGIVSYNIHCNFTNYGSALQSWALSESIKKMDYEPILVDYCPDILKDKNPLDPMKNMWDKDSESRKMCELSLPAIRVNYEKFDNFYTTKFNRTKKEYDSRNFDDIVKDENVRNFVCGSDTIFCVDEFGIDDGYYANYDCMKNGYTFSYAASFGDSHFNNETFKVLNDRLKNFKAIGIRENGMVDYIKKQVNVPVQKVCDPTLLLTADEYNKIISNNCRDKDKYLLLYARRYNKKMEEYAEKIAKENGWKIIEISLRATNAKKHIMAYDAGVEEFLSLVKNAQFVVTNSFHGMIFSVQFKKQFVVFSREQCDTKIIELLQTFGLTDRMLVTGNEKYNKEINYELVHKNIDEFRKNSLLFLKNQLLKIE